ncbi:MAG: hypothetical protein U0795_23465 [Pirellulales bacterium]
MVMLNSSGIILEVTAEQAMMATAIVLGIVENREQIENWSRAMRGFTPDELLYLWNEVHADVTRKLGPNTLLARIQLFDNKRVRIECRDLTNPSEVKAIESPLN